VLEYSHPPLGERIAAIAKYLDEAEHIIAREE
jgi:Zn-dependent protease with chaperone function